MYTRHTSRFSRAAFAAIETLEQRRLLSTVALVDNGDGSNTLKITGTNSKDTVTIYDDPANNSVEVVDDKNHNGIDDPGEVKTFNPANLHNVDANMKKGDDTVEIEPVSTYVGQQRSFDIDLMEGNDHFTFVSPTVPEGGGVPGAQQVDPNGADITNRSDISFTVEGETGNDHLTFDLSRTSIIESAVSINADTEAGNDTVDLLLPDATQMERGITGLGVKEPVTGVSLQDSIVGAIPAELQVEIDLGSGNDTMNLTTLTGMDAAIVNINVLGDSGKDTFNDQEDFGLFDATFTVNADMGSGDDSYNAHFVFGNGQLRATADPVVPDGTLIGEPTIEIAEGSTASFNIQGSTGNDKLIMHDTNIPAVFGGEQIFGPVPIQLGAAISGEIDMEAHGGFGNDTVVLDLNPTAIITVSPTGTFRGIVSGDDGADKVRLRVVGDGGLGGPLVAQEPTLGTFDLAALGGGDNDKVSVAFFLLDDAENNPDHYGPRGAILLDGGRGTDRYLAIGNGLVNIRGVEILDPTLEKPFV